MTEQELDPGAVLAIKLLDESLNGSDEIDMNKALKALGEAAKANLQISCNNNSKITTHVDDKDLHTAKGLLLKNDVIAWFLGLILLISAIVAHLPEVITYVIGLIP